MVDKVIGIVGLGIIGRGVAKVAEALGMEVRFHDNRRVAQEVGQEMGWKSLPLRAEHFDLQAGPEPKRRQINRRYTWGPYARELLTVCTGTDWASTCEVRLVVGEGC